jgi:hypothetical protein
MRGSPDLAGATGASVVATGAALPGARGASVPAVAANFATAAAAAGLPTFAAIGASATRAEGVDVGAAVDDDLADTGASAGLATTPSLR